MYSTYCIVGTGTASLRHFISGGVVKTEPVEEVEEIVVEADADACRQETPSSLLKVQVSTQVFLISSLSDQKRFLLDPGPTC